LRRSARSDKAQAACVRARDDANDDKAQLTGITAKNAARASN
jgi:hypothetical protein